MREKIDFRNMEFEIEEEIMVEEILSHDHGTFVKAGKYKLTGDSKELIFSSKDNYRYFVEEVSTGNCQLVRCEK